MNAVNQPYCSQGFLTVVSKFISDIRPPAHYTNTFYKHKYYNVQYMHGKSIYMYYVYNIFIILYICTDIQTVQYIWILFLCFLASVNMPNRAKPRQLKVCLETF